MSPHSPGPVGITDNPLRGIAYAVVAIILYSFLDGTAKYLVTVAPILQIVAIRSVFVLIALSPAVVRAGGLPALATARPWPHLARIATSFFAILMFFESLRHLPLATCIAISFAAPLFMTAASVVLLRERVGLHRWAAVGVGFVGVLIIARPDGEGLYSWPALLVIASSLFFALSQITVRWLAATETDLRILVSQNFGLLVLSGIALPFVWQPVPWSTVAGIAAMAVLLILGQLFTVKAFRAAPVGVVAPFQYTELLWATLIGAALGDPWPELHVWIGAVIVVASGLYVLWRETLARRQTAPLP
ncbi:MAG: DMT family transporter [Alphaproteobacteria bacterium]|nr:DMT family transporter [Alphaproteobacteria bacterium]